METISTADALTRAMEHLAAGRLHEAAGFYAQVLRQDPQQVDALNLLGLIQLQTGQALEAEKLLSRAVALRPEVAEFHSNRAAALLQLGKLEESIASCHRALQLHPNLAGAHQNLAQALQRCNRLAEAEDACRKAIALSPGDAGLRQLLAVILQSRDRRDDAERSCRRALQLNPNLAAAWNTLGAIHQDQGRVDESIACIKKAIALRPDSPTANYNYSVALLLSGKLREGFEAYEWRQWCDPSRIPAQYAAPLWDGSALNGRIILLHAEQGFGDTIQFVRYVPMVAARGGRVIVACHPELRRLIQTVEGVSEVVDINRPPPPFDVHLPLPSLPKTFGTDLETVPAQVPYLRVPERLKQPWRERVMSAGKNPKVGIAWAGNPQHGNDRHRTIPAELLGPLFETPAVTFLSLQKQRDAAATLPFSTIDLMAEVTDFADAAAVISQLDLIVSVDTAVAHLAGALGKPAWVLLPFAPDWRWMRDRKDSPWYPSLRLFRQPSPGDWQSVIHDVRDALLTFRASPISR